MLFSSRRPVCSPKTAATSLTAVRVPQTETVTVTQNWQKYPLPNLGIPCNHSPRGVLSGPNNEQLAVTFLPWHSFPSRKFLPLVSHKSISLLILKLACLKLLFLTGEWLVETTIEAWSCIWVCIQWHTDFFFLMSPQCCPTLMSGRIPLTAVWHVHWCNCQISTWRASAALNM